VFLGCCRFSPYLTILGVYSFYLLYIGLPAADAPRRRNARSAMLLAVIVCAIIGVGADLLAAADAARHARDVSRRPAPVTSRDCRSFLARLVLEDDRTIVTP